MPAPNYTPIQLYRTNTASTTAPSAGNLNAGELAINYNDGGMILFAKNTTGNVIKLMNNPANLLYPTTDGTAGQFISTNGSGTLSFTSGLSLATPLAVIGNATAGAEIRLPEDTDNGSNYVALKAADSLASNLTFTLPSADGTSGQFLKTDGAGTLSFGAVTSAALTNNTRQAVTSSATTTIDLNSGNVIDLTMAASIATLSFTNVPASGTPILIQIVVKNASDGTAYYITWPNSVYWSGQYAATSVNTVQSAPALATGANGVTVIALLTTDGGTKWRGWVEATIPGGSAQNLYTWGDNNFGQLASNNTTLRSSPVQVGSLSDWLLVSADANGTSCLAIKVDGTLWGWGNNGSGQLGQGNQTNRSSPVQVGTLTNWASVSIQYSSCTAIKVDGTLWNWGSNGFGQVGDNSYTNRLSPVQIGTLTTWASSQMGKTFCAAIKRDGTLWTWGQAFGGRLGQNDAINRSSPTQVGALTDWAKVSPGVRHCAAIKTNGTLWSWGYNNSGELGQNNTTNRSSPVQVGAATDWVSISAGSYTCAAIKTGGTLWAWGNNPNGELGLNTDQNRSSPTQVGALTTWSKIDMGNLANLAIKTDGTLWAWGSNGQGALGQNDTTTRSSPVQVGAATDWGFASAGGGFSAAGRIITTVNPN